MQRRPESGLLEGIYLVTSPSSREIREGSQRGRLGCPLAEKEREVCSWKKAQLVQRPGSRSQSAVCEAVRTVVRPQWRVSSGWGQQG